METHWVPAQPKTRVAHSHTATPPVVLSLAPGKGVEGFLYLTWWLCLRAKHRRVIARATRRADERQHCALALSRGFAVSTKLSCRFNGGASGDAAAATVVRASYVSMRLRESARRRRRCGARRRLSFVFVVRHSIRRVVSRGWAKFGMARGGARPTQPNI